MSFSYACCPFGMIFVIIVGLLVVCGGCGYLRGCRYGRFLGGRGGWDEGVGKDVKDSECVRSYEYAEVWFGLVVMVYIGVCLIFHTL